MQDLASILASIMAQKSAPSAVQAPSDVAAPFGMPAIPPAGGEQVAQNSPIQMRPIGNGQVQVINIQTGQVLYTGSASGAANAQASSAGQRRRIID